MKEQIIQLPDNFEIKEIKDGKIILVEKEKENKLTYEEVAKAIFKDNLATFYTTSNGIVHQYTCSIDYSNKNNALSKRQLEKLLAINKLMNVAKYLNGNWQPDWYNTSENKYYIKIEYGKIAIDYAFITNHMDIYFKSRELAEKAIEILGEETIRLALCTNY